jgi:hypothetical protein
MAMRCAYHPQAEAVGACVSCGRLVCAECKVELQGKIYCNSCAEKILLGKIKKDTGMPVGAVTAEENTSGQGSLAVVPQEIRGWNWGAFLLNWIWAIGNNAWLGLLALIPYFNIIWIFVLGAKGTEWAWRSKRWDSIEHYRRTQKTWAIVGGCLWGAGAIIWLLVIIFAAIGSGY